MRVRGAVALVTGASSGIGAATARALAAAGAMPLLAGRDRDRLQAVARETGGTVLEADLAVPDGPGILAAEAQRAAARPGAGPGAPGIDILVCNAGAGWSGPLGEMSAAKITELVAVNLTAPMQLTRLLAPDMAARGRGCLVFISSIAGTTGVRGEAVYSATKAGLGCFAESLRYELGGHGVGVSVIVPGVIDTPFFERRGRPYGRSRPRPLPAERVAGAVLAAIARGRPVAYVPRWMGLPTWLHGTIPGAYRLLAGRYGDPR